MTSVNPSVHGRASDPNLPPRRRKGNANKLATLAIRLAAIRARICLETVAATGTGRADDGLRTRDLQLGKLALYQLSYVRVSEYSSTERVASGRLTKGELT